MCFTFFLFNDTATTEIYTLSLHDALPISMPKISACSHGRPSSRPTSGQANSAKTKMQSPAAPRSEEHTSELQSQSNLVCRLLLEKKKDNNSFKTPFAVHELVATVLSSNCA